jgi:cytochrome c-type biogenesis protein CcmH/NrfF
MTVTLAALAMVVITAALLLEEQSWQRRRARLAARRAVPSPVRCMVCPNAPMVDDFRTHSRLAHIPRERAAEDFPEWSNQK